MSSLLKSPAARAEPNLSLRLRGIQCAGRVLVDEQRRAAGGGQPGGRSVDDHDTAAVGDRSDVLARIANRQVADVVAVKVAPRCPGAAGDAQAALRPFVVFAFAFAAAILGAVDGSIEFAAAFPVVTGSWTNPDSADALVANNKANPQAEPTNAHVIRDLSIRPSPIQPGEQFHVTRAVYFEGQSPASKSLPPSSMEPDVPVALRKISPNPNPSVTGPRVAMPADPRARFEDVHVVRTGEKVSGGDAAGARADDGNSLSLAGAGGCGKGRPGHRAHPGPPRRRRP